MIVAIDPGNEQSGVVMIDDDLRPVIACKLTNQELLTDIWNEEFIGCDVAIEMVASYGMAVGKTVFDTCVWIGRFVEAFEKINKVKVTLIYRKDEKMNLCQSMRAKDSNIIQALIDRFTPEATDIHKAKGTKKNPNWFYGFKKDIWQAYAVGVTYYDLYLKMSK